MKCNTCSQDPCVCCKKCNGYPCICDALKDAFDGMKKCSKCGNVVCTCNDKRQVKIDELSLTDMIRFGHIDEAAAKVETKLESFWCSFGGKICDKIGW